MTGGVPDPYRTGPTDPNAARPDAGGWYPPTVPGGPGHRPDTGGPWAAGAPLPPPVAYPDPGAWEPAGYLPAAGLPGVGIGGTVVGYVLAGLLLVTGFLLLVGASVVSALSAGADGTPRYHVAEFVVAGLANWAAAGLLVAGGVLLTAHRAAGRVALLVGAALVGVLSIYWVVRFPIGGVVGWAVAFGLLAATTAALVLPPAVGSWLAAPRRPGGPSPAPPGSGPFVGGGPFGS